MLLFPIFCEVGHRGSCCNLCQRVFCLCFIFILLFYLFYIHINIQKEKKIIYENTLWLSKNSQSKWHLNHDLFPPSHMSPLLAATISHSFQDEEFKLLVSATEKLWETFLHASASPCWTKVLCQVQEIKNTVVLIRLAPAHSPHWKRPNKRIRNYFSALHLEKKLGFYFIL